MDLKTYVINLANAPERMAYIRGQLEQLEIPYERIDAVFGDLIPEPIADYDENKFHRLFGKVTNKRVIGCYFSHINAMREFLKTGDSHALILEDDATLRVLFGFPFYFGEKYFKQQMFRAGIYGFIMAVGIASNRWLKDAKMYELHLAKNGRNEIADLDQ